MACMITVGAAQTGPVNEDDWRPNVAVASSDTPEVLVATVDLDNVAAAQTSLPWWRDRRPELYGSLSAA